jgi:hypothetical protein
MGFDSSRVNPAIVSRQEQQAFIPIYNGSLGTVQGINTDMPEIAYRILLRNQRCHLSDNRVSTPWPSPSSAARRSAGVFGSS